VQSLLGPSNLSHACKVLESPTPGPRRLGSPKLQEHGLTTDSHHAIIAGCITSFACRQSLWSHSPPAPDVLEVSKCTCMHVIWPPQKPGLCHECLAIFAGGDLQGGSGMWHSSSSSSPGSSHDTADVLDTIPSSKSPSSSLGGRPH